MYMTTTGTARIGFDPYNRAVFARVEILDIFSRGRFAHVRIIDPSAVPADLIDRKTILGMSASGGLGTPVVCIYDVDGGPWCDIPKAG